MTKKAAAPSIRFKGFSDAWEQRKVGDFYDFKNGLNKGKAFSGKERLLLTLRMFFTSVGSPPKCCVAG